MVTATEIRKGIAGIETEAFGADPSQIDKVYQFRYRVVDLDDVIPSHNDNLTPNSKYLAELQPRLRDRAASRIQIDNIAKNLNPRALLQDSGFIDTGPMIVGDDLIVESGNGRVLALRKAAQDFPEQYGKYKNMLEAMAGRFGIDKDKLASIDNPVLVRERITPVDRVKFAAEANVGAVMAMSPYEQALQDSGRLSPSVIGNLEVGEEQTIDQALRMRSNDNIIKHFVSNIPSTERASIADEKGAINQQGIDRLKLAIFARTYTGDAGKRLVRIFGESADPMVKSIENAMFASLPDMAKAEGLIDAGQRESDLSIAADMAEVVDTYASLKATGLTIKDYLAQQAMFEERLNPFQRKLLEHLDDTARKPRQVREMLRDIAGKIVDAPPKGQIGMMGLEPLAKEAMVYATINRQREETGHTPFPVAATAPAGKELEKPDTPGAESAGRLGQGVGFRTGEDTGLAARTSVQVGLAGLGKEHAQVRMLEEFGGAPGSAGKKETLIDVEAEKRKEAAKPLPGQVALEETKPTPTPEVTEPKLPYEITKAEFVADRARRLEDVLMVDPKKRISSEVLHRRSVKDALDSGWAVPPEVLKDYPEFKPLKSKSERVKRVAKGKAPAKAKGKRYTKAELREIHAGRSVRSQISDNRQLHGQVIDINSPRVDNWITKPGSADISGVDTPITKRTPRLSGGRARITPKTPRLRR